MLTCCWYRCFMRLNGSVVYIWSLVGQAYSFGDLWGRLRGASLWCRCSTFVDALLACPLFVLICIHACWFIRVGPWRIKGRMSCFAIIVCIIRLKTSFEYSFRICNTLVVTRRIIILTQCTALRILCTQFQEYPCFIFNYPRSNIFHYLNLLLLGRKVINNLFQSMRIRIFH